MNNELNNILDLIGWLLGKINKLEKRIEELEKRPYSVSCKSSGITKDYPHENYPL